MDPGPDTPTVLALVGLLLGLAVSAACSGLETGMYALNRVRLELRRAQGRRSAARLARAWARPQEFLTAILLVNNAANFLITMCILTLYQDAGTARPDLYTTLTATPLIFTLGEVVPKNVFRVGGETLTYALSGLVTWFMRLARWTGIGPMLMGLSRLVLWMAPGRVARAEGGLIEPRQRIQAFLAEGHAHGVLTPFQSHLARRVVSLRTTRVREVMVPLARVASLPVDCSRERFLKALPALRHTRLPVWRERPGNVVGIVNIYDVLFDENPQARPADHVKQPPRVLDQLSVSEALIALQRAHQSIGLVVNAMDKLVGIVTVQDLVEEIVGELEEN